MPGNFFILLHETIVRLYHMDCVLSTNLFADPRDHVASNALRLTACNRCYCSICINHNSMYCDHLFMYASSLTIVLREIIRSEAI